MVESNNVIQYVDHCCLMMQVSGVSFKPASLLPVVLMALENGFVLAALLRLLFPYDAMHVSRYQE